MDDAVTYEAADGIAVITLNRPERRNALSRDMSRALNRAWVRAAGDPSLRVVILAAAGTVFCAGGDPNVLGKGTPAGEEPVISPLDPDPQYAAALPSTPPYLRSRYLFARALPIPVIAAVNGLAIGAGLALALSADIRVGSSDAAFQAGFVRLGAAPELGLCWTLADQLGQARARDLLLTGRRVQAPEALDWGMITQLTTPERLLAHCRELATEIATRNAPLSTRLTKEFLNAAPTQSFAEAVELSRLTAAPAMAGPQFREGIAALREKRLPLWPAESGAGPNGEHQP